MDYTKLSNQEACSLLRTRLKPYLQITPPMVQSKFSTTLRNIENNMIKPKTAKSFLSLFGFSGDYNLWSIDINEWTLTAKS